MINFMKNSLISRFVMLFLFVFGCGTMSPIPALADYSEVLLTNSNGADYVSAKSGAGLYDYVGHGDCDADARVGLEVLFNLLPNDEDHNTIDFTPYAPDARTFNNDYAMVHDYDTDPDVFYDMTLYDILSQAQSAADSESLWNPVVRCQFLDSTYMYSDEFYGPDAQIILMSNGGIAEKLSTVGGSRKWLNAFTLLPSEGRFLSLATKRLIVACH